MELEPPDGGWGWVVVFGVALSNMTAQSLVNVFGLLLAPKVLEMGFDTTSTAIVINCNIALLNFCGLAAGSLMKLWSYRVVALCGGALVGAGLALSSLASTLWHLLLTFSLLAGVGLGFLQAAGFVAISLYFKASRGRAMGLALAGTGAGQVLMPQLIAFLQDEFDFGGVVLVLGALALHSVAGALLFQPLHWHAAPRSPDLLPLSKLHGAKIEEAPRRNPYVQLLCDPTFLNACVGLSVVYASGINFSVILPFLLQQDLGLSSHSTASCMSVLSAADIASRLLVPVVTDRLGLKYRPVFLVSAVLVASLRTVMTFTTSFTATVIICFLCGFMRGISVVFLNLTTSVLCKTDLLPYAVSINMVMKGIAIFAIGPLAGVVRDRTGSFPVCIYMLSCFIFVFMAFWVAEIVFLRHRKTRTAS